LTVFVDNPDYRWTDKPTSQDDTYVISLAEVVNNYNSNKLRL